MQALIGHFGAQPEFPGEQFDVWVDGIEVSIDLSDYGADPVKVASMESTSGSGGFAAVPVRAPPKA